ncbi:MAG: hypothetical protein JOY66_00205 [Acetobacteraceae bacterium]|nr:hypothetical protein [Acetobacteraceae bacterium]
MARDRLGRGLRVLLHRRYAIYYLADPTGVVIARVTHGARDVAALAERGGLTGEKLE